jgi:hypothetical protein
MNLTAEYLKNEASRSMWQRMIVVFVFHVLSAVSLLRYFSKKYTLPKDRLVVQ